MSGDTLRSVSLRRTGAGRFVATNARGVELPFGSGEDDFSPVELLLAAIAGCSALDVEAPTARRAEPDSFELRATADKVRDETGNHLENIEVVFRVAFPPGEGGDAARAMLPDMVTRSHDRLCTVTRTVERRTPVTTRIEQPSEQAGQQPSEQAGQQAGQQASEQAGQQAGQQASEQAGEPPSERSAR